MRITLVSPFDPRPRRHDSRNGFVGGVERVFDHVSRHLARRGHEVTLLCTTDSQPGRAQEDGLEVVRVRRLGTVLRAPVAALASHIRTDADLVHVAGTYPFTTTSVLRRAKALGVASVLDFHFEPAPGTFVGRLAAGLYRPLSAGAYRTADAVVVRSMDYGRHSPSLAAVPEDRWRVVPNGIDTNRFHPLHKRRDGRYLLFVGRLVPYKGLETLIRALARARVGVPLVVVGDGPLRAALARLATQLGVDVRFAGHVADEDLPTAYQGAIATVLPSVTRQEAFGIALVESMACGTPVVASDLPGVRELASLGGVVARRGDVDDLAEKIRMVVAGPATLRGHALAQVVHRRFSWEAVTTRLMEVYAEVAEAPTLAGPIEVSVAADPVRQSLL